MLTDLDTHLNIDTRTTMDTPSNLPGWIDLAWRRLAPAQTAATPTPAAAGVLAQRLHRLLALYPEHQIDGELLVALGETVISTDSATAARPGAESTTIAARAADLLVQAGLYQREPNPTAGQWWITILPAVHAHARQALRDAIASRQVAELERQAAVRVMCDYTLVRAWEVDRLVTPDRTAPDYACVQPPPGDLFGGDRLRALDWMQDTRYVLTDLAQVAFCHGLPETAVRLIDALSPLLLHREHPDLRMRADGIGVRAAKAWVVAAARLASAGAEPEAARLVAATSEWAAMMMRTGRGLDIRGRHEAAAEWLRRSHRKYMLIRDHHGEMSVLDAFADQFRLRGEGYLALADTSVQDDADQHLSHAANYLRQAVTAYNDVLSNRRSHGTERHVALTKLNLGASHRALAQTATPPDPTHLDLADLYLREAHDAFAELDNPHPHNTARLLQVRGQLRLIQGNLELARRDLADALDVFEGYDDYEIPKTLILLADVAACGHDRAGEMERLRSVQRVHEEHGRKPDARIEQRLAALLAGAEQRS